MHESFVTLANHWLSRFEEGLAAGNESLLGSLFRDDCHWRDVLAFTWRIGTVSGLSNVLSALRRSPRATGFRIDPDRTPPRHATRAGTKCVEALFRFEMPHAACNGVVRLFPEDGKAWTLLTALDDLKGHEEHTGSRRPKGFAYSRDFEIGRASCRERV